MCLAVVQDIGSAKRREGIPQGTGAERLDVPSSEAKKGVLNELAGYSDGFGSKGLEAEKTEEDEYPHQRESSAQRLVPGAQAQADVVASGTEADEASCANQEARR